MEADSVLKPPQQHAGKRGLHRPFQQKAARLRMAALDLQVLDQGHTLAGPGGRDEIGRIRRLVVRPDQVKGGARTGHQQLGRAQRPIHSKAARPGELHHDRPRDPVVAGWKAERAVSLLDRVLDGLGIVGLAVAGGTEIARVRHKIQLVEGCWSVRANLAF